MANDAVDGDAPERHISGSTTGVIVRYVERVLGARATDDLLRAAGDVRALDEVTSLTGWSSYSQACALLEAAREVTGDPSAGLRIGEEMLRQHSGTEVSALLRSLGSPGEVLRNVAATAAKYSTVTTMQADHVGDTAATITAATAPPIQRHPMFCDYTAGLLSQASVLFGMDAAAVVETTCQTRSDDVCTFEVRWDPATSSEQDPAKRIEHLEAQLAAVTERVEALQATATELVSTQDVEVLLERIAHRAALAVRAPAHVLAVSLPGEAELRVHAHGIGATEREALVADVLRDAPDDHGGSRLIVDVASSRHRYGRLAAVYPEGSRFFSQERGMLQAYASQAAAALDSATAMAEVIRRNDTARDLLAMSSSLAQVVEPDEVAARIAAAVPRVVDCDVSGVFLWDPRAKVLAMRASSGLDEATDASFRALPLSPGESSTVAELLVHPRPTLLDHSIDDPMVVGMLELAGAEAAVVIPIAGGEEVFGFITTAVRSDVRRLSASADLTERLEGLAGQAVAALRNAKLLEQVRHQALHDSLTGLPNRVLLRDRLALALAQARRSGHRVGVLFLDLDGFKEINDSHGHAMGDVVIVEAGTRLRSSVREGDTVARVSGDEFAVVLPEVVDRCTCETVALNILEELRQPIVVDRVTFDVTASVGAVAGSADDAYDSLVRRADVAMYHAKQLGGNNVVVAGEGGDPTTTLLPGPPTAGH